MLTTFTSIRNTALLAVAGVLAACANGANLGTERVELGDFRLCYNIVTTNDAVEGPLSREADLDEFSRLIRAEVDRRFSRYEGDRLYHIAMHVDAYVLAVPGIPIVASPRSALIVSVNVWDDVLGRPLHDDPEQFTVLESATGSSLVGSGLTQTADQQMQVLAQNAAIRIENWLAENPEWFDHAVEGDDADTADADLPATPPALAGTGDSSGAEQCATPTGAIASES